MNKELNNRLLTIGLSKAQSRLLKHIYRNGRMTQADLCKDLGLDKSTVAKALSRMESDGLITKQVNPEDSRTFFVYPTEKANQIIPKMRDVLSSWTKDVTVNLTEAEKELFYSLLDKVTKEAVDICR